MAREAELAPQLHGGDPGRVRSDQVRAPEPQRRRGTRPVQHGARGDRRPTAARGAFPQVPPLEHPRLLAPPARAARIGGRKYLIRFGVLPAKGDGQERWKADFHQISLGRPSEVPEFGLIRGTKEALTQAVEDAAMERDPSRSA